MIFPDRSLWVQVINFLVLLFLLNRFLFRPILRRMEERDRGIRENLDSAAENRALSEKRMAEYESAIREAKQEGIESMLRVEREIAEETRRKLDEKRNEADRLTEDARARIENQSREAREGLEGKVKEIAGAVACRLAGREIRV